MTVAQPEISFPEKLEFLFHPARYKVGHGGRGSGKSWGFARALVIEGAKRPLRVLCAREIQKSIKDSVHRLLADQIAALNLGGAYEVQNTLIKARKGGEINFTGLRFNTTDIKSFEGADVCWVEEAQNVSKSSWDVLIPTIRKEASEIWVSFNPDLDTDETYKRFVKTPPPGAVVQEINWRDNPWFPDTLRAEMEHLKATDYDAYLNVWEGKCKQSVDGAIYAEELRAAVANKRITRVPYDESFPVHCFWDLGFADFTSIWFGQWVGMEWRVIDFYQNHLKKLAHYAKVLREKPYVYGKLHLPHDAEAKTLGTGQSVQEMLTELSFEVEIVPRLSLADGIAAGRALFSRAWIDEDNCIDGLQALRRYKYDFDADTGQYSKTPKHDDASHASDAWRYMAIAAQGVSAKRAEKHRTLPPAGRGRFDWMAG